MVQPRVDGHLENDAEDRDGEKQTPKVESTTEHDQLNARLQEEMRYQE